MRPVELAAIYGVQVLTLPVSVRQALWEARAAAICHQRLLRWKVNIPPDKKLLYETILVATGDAEKASNESFEFAMALRLKAAEAELDRRQEEAASGRR